MIKKITTVAANQNILQLEPMKAMIKERMGITTEKEYQLLISSKGLGLDISFDIIFSAINQVFINENLEANDIIENIVYTTNGRYYKRIKSIEIGTPCTCTINFEIL